MPSFSLSLSKFNDVLGNNVDLLAGIGHNALRLMLLTPLFAAVVKVALLSSSLSTRSSSSSDENDFDGMVSSSALLLLVLLDLQPFSGLCFPID